MMLEWLIGILRFLAFWKRKAVDEERLALADAEGHFLRGNALYLAEHYQEAITAFDRALEVWTAEHFPYYHGLGQRNREGARRRLGEKGGG